MHVSLQPVSIPLPVPVADNISDVGLPSGGASFTDAISAAIGNVESARSQAQYAASDLLLKGNGDVHTVALAAQSAELSVELFQQVRNKFVSAYQEIMKMPM